MSNLINSLQSTKFMSVPVVKRLQKPFSFTHDFTRKAFQGLDHQGKPIFKDLLFPLTITGTGIFHPTEPLDDQYRVKIDSAIDLSGADLWPFVEFQDSLDKMEIEDAAIAHVRATFHQKEEVEAFDHLINAIGTL